MPTMEQILRELQSLRRIIINQPRLHRKDVMVRYGWSESTLHRRIRDGRLPPPVMFSRPLWRLGDLEDAEIAGQLPRPVSA